jgi:DNA-binding NarL/FixJ family response regulator
MIKILLVDDQPIVRRGLRMRLALEPDILVVGEAASGQQALEAAAALSPDVVVMDVEMPEMDGIESAKILHDRYPEIVVIMLSIHDTVVQRLRAQAAGAAAYVEKSDGVVSLLNEIHRWAG